MNNKDKYLYVCHSEGWADPRGVFNGTDPAPKFEKTKGVNYSPSMEAWKLKCEGIGNEQLNKERQ